MLTFDDVATNGRRVRLLLRRRMLTFFVNTCTRATCYVGATTVLDYACYIPKCFGAICFKIMSSKYCGGF